MKIKHGEIDIPSENPFKNCKLDRKKYADVLTSIINSYADGFVLAINNEWGTGKTTFVKMWQQQLLNEGYKTLYFNAWENDFDSNPLVAILSELKTIIPKDNDATYKSLLSKGAILTKNVLPSLVKAIAERYIDTKVFIDAIENVASSAVKILEDEVDDYSKKKKGLIDFRKELESFVKNNSKEKPLVFIIDELDRCRPDYAVEVLEQVKHFFNVPGIIFILSIDKIQLSNAIRGFYGSEQIDAAEYLRRFIDVEYVIPQPTTGAFCKYLYGYFQFDDFFFSDERKTYTELINDKDLLLKIATVLFENKSATLRQQEKIFAHARLVLKTFNSNSYVFPTIFIFLIYLRDFESKLYRKIQNRELTPQALIEEIKVFFPKTFDGYDLRFYVSIEARLLMFYNNYYREINYTSKIVERDSESGKYQLLIKSGLEEGESPLFLGALEAYERTSTSNVSLIFLLKKIDLLENISM